MKRNKQVIILVFIFFAVFISHLGSRNIVSTDSTWSIPTAMSIIKEGNTNLDEYKAAETDHRVEKIDGHLYNIFPIGASLIAIPFVYIIDKGLHPILSILPNLEKYLRSRGHHPLGNTDTMDVIAIYPKVERFIASFVIALTAVLIYLLSCLFLDRKSSLFVVFIFAFCTSAWSTASRALWQHGPSMFMLTVALYLILLSKNKHRWIPFVSLPLAFSYVIRPTNSIPIFLLTIFIFLQYRPYFLRYLFLGMTIAIPFLLFNVSIYHSILSPYYFMQNVILNHAYLEALIANLISPARGLFIFSPIFLFSIYGVFLKIKNKQFGKIDAFLLGILFLHWMTISFVWAGASFGPRYFSEMIPFLIYFFIPVVAEIPKWRRVKKIVLVSILFFFVGISLMIHYSGANQGRTFLWNVIPTNIDIDRARIWDWHDLQFLRGWERY